jgi:DnaJ-class molecular chaperone
MQAYSNLDLDLEDDDLGSKKESVVLSLKNKNLLRYGSLIRETEIAEVMGVDQKSMPLDLWALTKLQLREIIKSEGFYVTSRGRENDLYILLEYEMPKYNEQKIKASYRALKQRTRALHMIDASVLSNEHQKKLEFEILRNASFEIEMSKSINMRCRV